MQSAPSSSSVPATSSRWRRMLTSPWLVVVIRLLIGGLFVFAGGSKLLLPYEEVVVMIEQYTVIPKTLVPWIAVALPWVELLSGAALCMGFLTTLASGVVAFQLVVFCLLMLVVLALGIEIEDCGCFGQWGWHETPLQVLIRDLIMLGLLFPVFWRRKDVWALDAWGLSNAESEIQNAE